MDHKVPVIATIPAFMALKFDYEGQTIVVLGFHKNNFKGNFHFGLSFSKSATLVELWEKKRKRFFRRQQNK